jgi:general stress protein 26
MDEKQKRLIDTLSHFTTAMLVTHDEKVGLRARPLTVADHDRDGSLWFFTSSESEKAAQIQRDAGVAVVMQDDKRFVSITGTARLDASPEQLDRLWRESFRPWFPGGARDPNAMALQVVPVSAEIWDLSGMSGVEYAIHAISAVVSGRRAPDPEDSSFHVRMERGSSA